MRNWINPLPETRKISFLLFPRFSNHCLANAVEPLRAANEMAGHNVYQWEFLTLDGKTVESSSGLPVTPTGKLRDRETGYALFVLPSYDVRQLTSFELNRGLQIASRRYQVLVGLDTGSWLLAAAGLLDGRRATIHLSEITAFEETFETVDVLPDRIVRDGNILTCGGAMTTFDLVLDMIGQHLGEARRLEICAFFLQPGTEAMSLGPNPSGSDLVDRAVSLMSGNIETPLPIGQIAGDLGTYQRKLSEEFRRTLGASPAQVYKRLRLLAAKRYAERSSYPIAEIAVRCGYQNAAALTRAFVQEFGQPPSVLARVHRQDASPYPR